MPTDTLIINGKKYVSTAKAADLAGYTPEHVSKLSCDGFVDGEHLGGISYVDFESFSGHMQEHGGEHKELFHGNLDRDPTMRTMRISVRESSDIAENPRTISAHTSRLDSSVGVRQGTQYRKDMNNSRDGVRPANTGTFLRYVGRGVMFLLIFTGVAYGWGALRSQVNMNEILSAMEVSVEKLATAVSEWSLPHTFLSQEISESQQASVIESRNVFS
jgi:hypothetical protein